MDTRQDKQKLVTRISDLESTIVTIHSLATHALSQIEAIANTSLLAMQTPDSYYFPENIAMTLDAIGSIAQSIHGCIDGEAECIGCTSPNNHSVARSAAHRISKK
ncbi:hypothetical protein [Marinospirillum insulare]|uniref:Uncharacterized protein n=1 Tax=Marinospirillum insulare TaxID=217169 RepID=A0ABQ5ZUS6_9GAMM|nr:hypothetical protein [Marinospirillum insulare]GLR63936.1 hypothetical protein GCM10007878_13740 [Marinospirillum insulare]